MIRGPTRRTKSCGRTLLENEFSVKARGSAEDHAEEYDGASSDVLPEGGDVQKHKRLLQRTEQQHAEECAQQTAAASENIRAAENDGSNYGEFVAICGVSLHRAELRGVKDRANGCQQAKRDIGEIDRLTRGNPCARGGER